MACSEVFRLTITDFQSLRIGLEVAEVFASSDKARFFCSSSPEKFDFTRGGTSSYKVRLSHSSVPTASSSMSHSRSTFGT